MLLNMEQMRKLKRKSVSKDVVKSAARIKEDYSAASASKKKEILAAASHAPSSMYRLYHDGNLNARVTIALATELNVSPFYYTGETDEKEPCTDDLVKAFLEQQGYADILNELNGVKPKRAYNKKSQTGTNAKSTAKKKSKPETKLNAKSAATSVSIDESTNTPMTDEEIDKAASEYVAEISKNFKVDKSMATAMDKLNYEEAIILLRALFIRAKAGGNAADDLDEVKRRLLS